MLDADCLSNIKFLVSQFHELTQSKVLIIKGSFVYLTVRYSALCPCLNHYQLST